MRATSTTVAELTPPRRASRSRRHLSFGVRSQSCEALPKRLEIWRRDVVPPPDGAETDFQPAFDRLRQTSQPVPTDRSTDRVGLDQRAHPSRRPHSSNGHENSVTAGTIAAIFHDVRWFFNWLNERNIASLDAVSEADFLAYSEHVAGRPVVRGVKGRMLFTVTRIWLLAPYLPAGDVLRMPTWERPETEGGNLNDIVGPANWTGENKTLPIHPQSMSALLLCALRFVNVFASDIVGRRAQRQAGNAGRHPKSHCA